jgi:hypothetical protein
VRDFRQLVDFLKGKDARIREATLDFDGRNALLYFHPDFSPRGAPAARPAPE